MCRLDQNPVTLCKQKMTTAGTASRWLSRSVRNPPQRLLVPSKTSSASPASSYSTSAHRRPATVLCRLTSRQLRSSRGLRPSHEPISSCVACGELAKARRKFTASTLSLHNELVPPKPGEEYVINTFSWASTEILQAPCHIH